MKHSFKNLNVKQRRLAITLPCLLLLAVLISLAGMFARYIRGFDAQVQGEPNLFCFTSDYLKETNQNEAAPTYTVYGNSVAFYIADNDGLNFSDDEIAYAISVSAGGTLTHSNDYVISAGEGQEGYVLTGEVGKTYTVTASSTSPYTKTITATFTFAKGSSSYYSVEDKGHYIVLKLTTGSTIGEIAVNYGSTFAPDNTDENMHGWMTADGTATLSSLVPNAYYELVFFELTAGDYTQPKTDLPNGTGTITLN